MSNEIDILAMSEENCAEEAQAAEQEEIFVETKAETEAEAEAKAETKILAFTGKLPLEEHVKEKLAAMLVVAGTQSAYYAVPIIDFLRKRIVEPDGIRLQEAIAQPQKDWTHLWGYITKKVREKAGGANCVAESDEVVYQMAVDYFFVDEAAEKKAAEKKAAEKKTSEKKAAEKKASEKKAAEKAEAEEELSIFDGFDFGFEQ